MPVQNPLANAQANQKYMDQIEKESRLSFNCRNGIGAGNLFGGRTSLSRTKFSGPGVIGANDARPKTGDKAPPMKETFSVTDRSCHVCSGPDSRMMKWHHQGMGNTLSGANEPYYICRRCSSFCASGPEQHLGEPASSYAIPGTVKAPEIQRSASECPSRASLGASPKGSQCGSRGASRSGISKTSRRSGSASRLSDSGSRLLAA